MAFDAKTWATNRPCFCIVAFRAGSVVRNGGDIPCESHVKRHFEHKVVKMRAWWIYDNCAKRFLPIVAIIKRHWPCGAAKPQRLENCVRMAGFLSEVPSSSTDAALWSTRPKKYRFYGCFRLECAVFAEIRRFWEYKIPPKGDLIVKEALLVGL